MILLKNHLIPSPFPCPSSPCPQLQLCAWVLSVQGSTAALDNFQQQRDENLSLAETDPLAGQDIFLLPSLARQCRDDMARAPLLVSPPRPPARPLSRPSRRTALHSLRCEGIILSTRREIPPPSPCRGVLELNSPTRALLTPRHTLRPPVRPPPPHRTPLISLVIRETRWLTSGASWPLCATA